MPTSRLPPPPGPLASPTTAASARHRLGWALCVVFVTAAVEGAGGMWAHSLALLADAGHLALDGVSLVLAYAAVRVAQRPPSWRYPFGLGRLEVFAALINAVSLWAMAYAIFAEALARQAGPHVGHVGIMAGTAVLGLTSNLVCLRVLHGHHHSISVHGAFLHVLGDAANSVGVALAALAVALTGNPSWDLWVSLVLACLIALSGVPLAQASLALLLLRSPTPERDAALAQRLAALPGIASVQALRLLRVQGGQVVALAQLCTSPQHAGQAQEILQGARACIAAAHPHADITVQLQAGPSA